MGVSHPIPQGFASRRFRWSRFHGQRWFLPKTPGRPWRSEFPCCRTGPKGRRGAWLPLRVTHAQNHLFCTPLDIKKGVKAVSFWWFFCFTPALVFVSSGELRHISGNLQPVTYERQSMKRSAIRRIFRGLLAVSVF